MTAIALPRVRRRERKPKPPLWRLAVGMVGLVLCNIAWRVLDWGNNPSDVMSLLFNGCLIYSWWPVVREQSPRPIVRWQRLSWVLLAAELALVAVGR
jgi:hypothetical protein